MTLSSRPLLLFVLALMLAAGLGAWQGRAARDEAPAAAAPEASPGEAAAEAAPALPEAFTDAPPVPELPGLPPLPPASTRLGEAWPALEARALAGDWRAGCRLADALSGCPAEDARRRAAYADVDSSASASPDCADVPTALIERRSVYRLAAALAGHRPSAEAFVVGVDFPRLTLFLSAGHEPMLLAYRRHYHAIRMALLDQGSVVAMAGHLQDRFDFEGLGPTRDEEAALLSTLRAAGVFPAEEEPSMAGMTARAEAWVQRARDRGEFARFRHVDDEYDPDKPGYHGWYMMRGLGLGDPTCVDAAR